MRKKPTPGQEKKLKLTRHFSAMDLVIQAPGNWMVPWQCFGPIPQLFPTTASEQGTLAVLSDGQVPQHL